MLGDVCLLFGLSWCASVVLGERNCFCGLCRLSSAMLSMCAKGRCLSVACLVLLVYACCLEAVRAEFLLTVAR